MKGVTIVEVINYSGTFGIVGVERETGVSRKIFGNVINIHEK